MTFAEKLLFVRAELNISQTQLAEQLGVAFTTIMALLRLIFLWLLL